MTESQVGVARAPKGTCPAPGAQSLRPPQLVPHWDKPPHFSPCSAVKTRGAAGACPCPGKSPRGGQGGGSPGPGAPLPPQGGFSGRRGHPRLTIYKLGRSPQLSPAEGPRGAEPGARLDLVDTRGLAEDRRLEGLPFQASGGWRPDGGAAVASRQVLSASRTTTNSSEKVHFRSSRVSFLLL